MSKNTLVHDLVHFTITAQLNSLNKLHVVLQSRGNFWRRTIHLYKIIWPYKLYRCNVVGPLLH